MFIGLVDFIALVFELRLRAVLFFMGRSCGYWLIGEIELILNSFELVFDRLSHRVIGFILDEFEMLYLCFEILFLYFAVLQLSHSICQCVLGIDLPRSVLLYL